MDFIFRRRNETHVSSNDKPLDTLTSHVEKLIVATCGIHYASGHSIDMCHTYQDDLSAQGNPFGGFPTKSQMWDYSYSNVYDQEWWDNSNFNYVARPTCSQHQYQQQQPSSMSGMSLEEMMKLLTANTYLFQ